jgi:hypothetical protein
MNWRRFLEGRSFRFDTDDGVARLRHTPENGTACVDLSHHGLLAFVGGDARAFLQGYLTCDVQSLAPERAQLGALCTLQGRVLADGILLDLDCAPTLWLHGSLVAPVTEMLRKYLAFSKTRTRDLADTYVTLGLMERPAPDIIDAPLAATRFDGGLAIRVPGAAPRWLLVLPLAAAQSLWTRYEALGRAGDDTAWVHADVEARWARIVAATRETFLPQMIGLTDLGGVSFEKGCYLGQEVVARAEHRGQVKRRLANATWRGHTAPAAGAALTGSSSRAIAMVVSAAALAPEKGVALVVTSSSGPTRAAAPGLEFEING